MARLVYLSGAIGGLSYEQASSWRFKATKILLSYNIACLDPMRGKEGLDNLSKIPALTEQNDIDWLNSKNWLVHRDLADIGQCDALLVELTDPTHPYRGTLMEMVYARQWNKPVIAWSSWVNAAPWIAYHTTLACETLEECCEAIREVLL